MTDDDTELPLAGGMGSGGEVVRVGSTVRRPFRPHSPAVTAFLRHLEAVGFAGAPRHLGIDERGREVLSWIDGDVALPPFPTWAGSEAILLGVAHLQRELHAAARDFQAPPDARWNRTNLGESGPGSIVCHNDLCVENVVVRHGEVVAFIDFDFAAPVDPLLDIAIAARHWIPIRDPRDIDPGLQGLDQVERFHRFCDVHDLEPARRRRAVAHLEEFLDRALLSMRTRAKAGLPAYVRAWEAGYEGQNRRSRAWIDAQRERLTK